MSHYCLPATYTARTKPEYFNDTKPDGKLWQPHVLPLTAHLARQQRCQRLIDIGCGRADRLAEYGDEFEVIGVDYGANIQYARMRYPKHRWLESDLEHETPDLEAHDWKGAGVVCADVIEHLVKPDMLLVTFSMALVCAPFVVLSTPDRNRTYNGQHDGPPGNVHHVREWTLAELTAFLRSWGFQIAWSGWTVSNNVDRQKNTSLVILSQREVCYNSNIESLFELEAAE
jgi:SAM-dependent methyltransferase